MPCGSRQEPVSTPTTPQIDKTPGYQRTQALEYWHFHATVTNVPTARLHYERCYVCSPRNSWPAFRHMRSDWPGRLRQMPNNRALGWAFLGSILLGLGGIFKLHMTVLRPGGGPLPRRSSLAFGKT